MKLLVTGSLGFLGSAVIRHIITTTNDEVVNLRKLSYSVSQAIVAKVSDNARCVLRQIDICNHQI